MIAPALPANEDIRLEELHSLNLLDTEAEADFDELIQLASYICECDISIMSLIDADRQWLKAKKGKIETEIPRSSSFCGHAILQKEVLIVEDALIDTRFFDNPLVVNGLIRFYAGAPIETENHLALGAICVLDVKPRKLTAEQIAALSKIARQAAILIELRRKNQLLKDQARQQEILREKAEKASRAQEQFLSTMSHEIRTPLNGVIGMIDLLSQNSPRADQVNDIEFLRRSSANLLHIVNDILDYNKIESGKLKIEKTRFNIRETIAEIIKIHELRAKQKGIQLDSFIDVRIPEFVIGDPARLKQVLNNLASNSIKFTEAGFVQLRLKLESNDESGMSPILFEVHDTGIGIEADKIPRIFDRFFQANANTTRIFGGTGLGLAITKKFLQLMGSDISVQSTFGAGSCFSFTINFASASQEPIVETDILCRTKEGKLDNLEILVAEDNRMNKVLMEKFLKKWNVNVDFAINGLEAIQKTSGKDYDLILMDLQMPEMDGYEATTYIRNKLKKNIPIIALTADALFDADRHIHENGLTDYILKPFSSTNLYNKICNHTLRK